jgi:hypothetical protein
MLNRGNKSVKDHAMEYGLIPSYGYINHMNIALLLEVKTTIQNVPEIKKIYAQHTVNKPLNKEQAEFAFWLLRPKELAPTPENGRASSPAKPSLERDSTAVFTYRDSCPNQENDDTPDKRNPISKKEATQPELQLIQKAFEYFYNDILLGDQPKKLLPELLEPAFTRIVAFKEGKVEEAVFCMFDVMKKHPCDAALTLPFITYCVYRIIQQHKEKPYLVDDAKDMLYHFFVDTQLICGNKSLEDVICLKNLTNKLASALNVRASNYDKIIRGDESEKINSNNPASSGLAFSQGFYKRPSLVPESAHGISAATP